MKLDALLIARFRPRVHKRLNIDTGALALNGGLGAKSDWHFIVQVPGDLIWLCCQDLLIFRFARLARF